MQEEVINTEGIESIEEIEEIEEIENTQDSEPQSLTNEDNDEAEINYEELVRQDVLALTKEFPELSEIKDITELENPIRYAALRDLGLTPAEAYLATSKKRRSVDTRSHLYSSVPGASALPKGTISERELTAARELFPDISDSEIRKLYKTVTK